MKDKVKGLFIFALFYILAYACGFIVLSYFDNMILKLFMFDITATLIIYIGSLIIKNASLYDAYWSLTPFVMLVYLMHVYGSNLNIYHLAFILAFSLWSNRLTINWIITYKDYHWMDWRYKMYKEKHPKLYPLISLTGIQLMPTLMVFVAFMPIVYIMQTQLDAKSLLGSIVILIGTALEYLADHDMHKHLNSQNKMDVCKEGLWKYSRHPNYLGEILIWVGVAITYVHCNNGPLLYSFNFLVMIFLFEFISIPMMEKRQLSRRKDYKEYQQHTSRLLLLKNK